MAAQKLPAIQFYPGDWHKDQGVQSLDLMQRGAWFEMLLMMHDSDERGVLLVNGQPMPEPVLARRLGLDNQTSNQILTTLLTYGVASRRETDGAIYCRRMVKDEYIRQIRADAGKKGGNPNLLNQNANQNGSKTEANANQSAKQIPTPSSSSSTTASITREEIAGATAPAPASVNPSPEPPPVPTPAQTSPQIAILPEKPGKKRGEKKPEEPKMLFADSQLAAPLALTAHLSAKGYPDADAGYYRRKISDWSAGENADGKPVQRTERGWATTVTGWLDRDKAKGCLMRQGAAGNQINHHVSQTERRQQAVNDAAALRQVMPYASGFTSSLGMAPPKETPQA